MTKWSEAKKTIQEGKLDAQLLRLYVDQSLVVKQRERYLEALDCFAKAFDSDCEIEIYSAPGRSEVCGNHTDHQNGMVLATSINLDAIAVVAKTTNSQIELVSGTMPKESVDLDKLTLVEEEKGTTTSLIKGVAKGLQERGFHVGGFQAYITSDVLIGAGMSSSAAFESLLGTILSGLHNDGNVPPVTIAQVGQYAENVYFGKPCGLMDQMACSVGGMVYIDFENPKLPVVEQVESDFHKAGLSLCIVDTKGSHADLTPDYAAVPEEMRQVAKVLGAEHLRQVEEQVFLDAIPTLWNQVSGRGILRAIHFFEEEKRVGEAVKRLRQQDYDGFLQVIKESGNSSAKYLQNIYSPKDIETQNVTVALAVSESWLGKNGVCRVHGGGFAGTIQAFVKNECVDAYKRTMEAIFGVGSCHILKVRSYGGVKVM